MMQRADQNIDWALYLVGSLSFKPSSPVWTVFLMCVREMRSVTPSVNEHALHGQVTKKKKERMVRNNLPRG